MTTPRAILWGLCLLLAIVVWRRPAMAEPQPGPPETNQGCATDQCHPNLMAKDRPLPQGHDDCLHCHRKADDKATHPTPGTKTFTLPGQGICLDCHQGTVAYDYLHPPAAAGDCLVCHTFHRSGADDAMQVDRQGQSRCYACHPPVAGPQDTVLHGDVAKQRCIACHTVHGSFFKHLFTASYSTDFTNDFDEKQYALCFQCHKIDLLLYPTTSYNTKFRDGQKNLHFTHVNRTNRGRACKVCHAPHASRNPRLMNDTVSFGDWEMPLNFILTDRGGQCTPGCHSQRKYTRDDEADSDEATANPSGAAPPPAAKGHYPPPANGESSHARKP